MAPTHCAERKLPSFINKPAISGPFKFFLATQKSKAQCDILVSTLKMHSPSLRVQKFS